MSRASRYLRNCIVALAFWAILCFNRAAWFPIEYHLIILCVREGLLLVVLFMLVADFGGYCFWNVCCWEHSVSFDYLQRVSSSSSRTAKGKKAKNSEI